MKRTERNFWLDIGLFVIFLSTVFTGLLLWRLIPHQTAAVLLGFTRKVWLTAHSCCGLASAAGIAIHLAWHQDWLKALRGRSLGGMPKKLRANRVVDKIMWITFIAATVFGAIAWALHFGEDIYTVRVPDRLHVAFGVAWTILTTVHLALHRQWIASTAQRYLHVHFGSKNDFMTIAMNKEGHP